MNTLPLPHPPSFDYVSTGPWMVTHSYAKDDPDHQTWIMWTLDHAVIQFWRFTDHGEPIRRVVVDAYGVVVLGLTTAPDAAPRVVSTREMFDVALKMAPNPDTQAEILWLGDKLAQGEGAAL